MLSNIKHICSVCNKQYTKKSSLKNHQVLCEFKYKTSHEKKVDAEEEDDLPTYGELVKIVMHLSQKCDGLETELSLMQRWINKKKKKINVSQWLIDNVHPTFSFTEWIMSYIEVSEQHIMYLFEKPLYDFIYYVYDTNLSNANMVYPIKSFSEKNHIIYICDKKETGNHWRKLETEDFALLLKKIRNTMIKIILEWKTKNQEKLTNDRHFEEKYNKAIIKLMNINFTPDAAFNHMKNDLYNYVKTDLKSVIEYDFEF